LWFVGVSLAQNFPASRAVVDWIEEAMDRRVEDRDHLRPASAGLEEDVVVALDVLGEGLRSKADLDREDLAAHFEGPGSCEALCPRLVEVPAQHLL
jgi:hypothetical protein